MLPSWKLLHKLHSNLGNAGLTLTVPEVNSMGLAIFGGNSLEQAFAQDYDTVVIVENDLYRRLPAKQVDAALAKAKKRDCA